MEVFVGLPLEDYDDNISLCPFCNEVGYMELTSGSGPYDGGILFYMCHENCGGLGCIDIDNSEIDKRTDAFLNYNVDISCVPKKLLDSVDSEYRFIKLPLSFIKRLCSGQLQYYDSDEQLTNDDVRKFIENNFSNNSSIYKVENENRGDPSFNISLDVNSYNIFKPQVDYPNGLNIEIAGERTWMELENGKKHYIEGC